MIGGGWALSAAPRLNGTFNVKRESGDLFAAAGHDFYKLDPLLFSPAMVTFVDLNTGRRRTFGELRSDVLSRSFGE